MEKLIDWSSLDEEIGKVYKRGLSVDGRPAYKGILLFKMLLLGIWYDLSDERVEEMVNDSLSAMRFCGLNIEDNVPDHSVLSRFRSELTQKKSFERLLKRINSQLASHKVIIRHGIGIIDASITESPFCPKGRPRYEVVEDREEGCRKEEEWEKEIRAMQIIKHEKPGVDTEARYLKKGKKLYYGYKKQVLTDENGMQLSVHTVPANEHDSWGLTPCIEKQDKKLSVKSCFADKGYQVPDNVKYLKKEKIKNRIMHKAVRNKPLSERAKLFNKLISKKRWVVERTFGGMKRWFRTGRARYKGLAGTHTQHLLEAIAYNLYRAPGIIVSNAKK
ncbi:MAG: IS5 family transposase [Bacteroidales bacterium]|nr:IS5 family transposase [Bacteroidales bacterium]